MKTLSLIALVALSNSLGVAADLLEKTRDLLRRQEVRTSSRIFRDDQKAKLQVIEEFSVANRIVIGRT